MKLRNTMPSRILPVLALALLAGCAANPDPIIDTKGVDKARLAEDWQECEQFSKEVNVPTGVAKGAGRRPRRPRRRGPRP